MRHLQFDWHTRAFSGINAVSDQPTAPRNWSYCSELSPGGVNEGDHCHEGYPRYVVLACTTPEDEFWTERNRRVSRATYPPIA